MPHSRSDENHSEANNMAMPSTDEARYAALSMQVQGLDADYKELKGIVVGLDRKLEASNAALSNKVELMVNGLGAKFDASVTGIQSKLDERSRIPWQAWGVVVTVLIAIGALVYWPIREGGAQTRLDLQDLANKVVFSKRYEGEQIGQDRRVGELIETVRVLKNETIKAFEHERQITDRVFQERSFHIARNTADINKILERLNDARETLTRHDQAAKNLESRFDAISRRLAEHIRDVTRIDRRN